MSLHTPPESHAPAAHPRGVFREPFSMNGTIVFNVYRCDGELMEMAFVHPEWNPDTREQELVGSLDMHCPIDDPGRHRVICRGSHRALRVV